MVAPPRRGLERVALAAPFAWDTVLSRRIPRKPLSSIDLTTLAAFHLAPPEESQLDRGILLFNAGAFWEAHEAWEEIWQNRAEDGRFFIQGLIQLAAAYHQLSRKVYRGFVIHLEQARARLKLFPPQFLGIDVAAILGTINGSMAAIHGRDSLADVDWQAIKVARIERCQQQPH
jgi:predicted metal-dependent hydrolase